MRLNGISDSFNRALEWDDKGWDEKKGVFPISPALRATDYKCPKYVWFYEEV